MKIYLVGGAVRDKLMGREPKDLDYVVVGSTPEEMIEKGFRKVGADFPVFLHPDTNDEYALARTERKSGAGYKGFECEWEGVTLEEDLSRRDLTINSIAQDIETGEIIDPFNGQSDIKCKVLRHTTNAFTEDPLRVLRVARFRSRFGPEWKIDKTTKRLLYWIEGQGELENLTPERVWKELEKTFTEKFPSILFSELYPFASLFPDTWKMIITPQRLDHHPEDDVWSHTALVMDYAAQTWNDAEVVFSCYTHDFGKSECYDLYQSAHGHEQIGLKHIEAFCDKWKVPNKYRELALLSCEFHTKVHGCLGRSTNKGMRPKSIMKMFEQTKALVKTERFEKILKVCEADAKGRGVEVHEDYTKTKEYFLRKDYPQRQYLSECLEAAKSVNTKEISTRMLTEGKSGIMIGEQIRVERINAIRGVYNLWKNQQT